MQVFNNAMFGNVQLRTVTKEGTDEVWFCLKDVCEALKLHTNKVIQRLEDGVLSRYPLLTNGGTQEVTFVNEDGMYDIVIDSRKPEAKKFRKWITSEVLPSIRRNGGYIATDPEDSDEMILAKSILVAQRMIDKQHKQIADLQAQNDDLEFKNEKLNDELEYFRDATDSEHVYYTTSEVATNVNMTVIALNKFLIEHKIQYKRGGRYYLRAPYCRYDLARTVEHPYKDKDGNSKMRTDLRWTEKGKEFIQHYVTDHKKAQLELEFDKMLNK